MEVQDEGIGVEEEFVLYLGLQLDFLKPNVNLKSSNDKREVHRVCEHHTIVMSMHECTCVTPPSICANFV